MRSAVIYYSYSGNTKKVAKVLIGRLKEKGEVDIIELTALDESNKFFSQCARAIRHKRAQIAPVNPDLSGYDLICLGTPVWAFAPAPAVNTFLDECSGVGAKPAVLFTTYGSGTGKERCADYMQQILTKKGVGNFKRFSVQQSKVDDKEFVLSKMPL
ncbi:flavodoxin family protein [Candidatus Omnitrophota bacterium]